MASRYWVGGAGTWIAGVTTNWSATSGGAGGASVPTSADDVIFDANSGTGTVTVYNTQTCASLTGFPGITLAGGTTPSIQVYGTVADLNFTSIGTTIAWQFRGVGTTLVSRGKSLGNVQITGSASVSVLLGGALTSVGSITLTQGTFDTASYAVTATALLSTNSNTRAIYLRGSTVTLTSTTPLDLSSSSGLTFAAGTSQITCSSSAPTFAGGGATFYNVSFNSGGTGPFTFTGANAFNNLSIAGRSTTGLTLVSLAANQTINGTLTLFAGSSPTARTFLQSSVLATTRTLTVNSFATASADIDFRDIAVAGAAAPISGTRFGDCRGNSGITFDAPKTVYWNATAGNWTGNGWATTVGGVPAATNFPLAQDYAVFSSVTLPSAGTITISANWNIGTIDMSARTTNTMTLATGTSTPAIYGNWINGTGVTLTGSGIVTFAGRGSQTITSAGRTFTQGITIDNPSGTVTTTENLTLSSSSQFRLTSGTFDMTDKTVTAGQFFSNTAGRTRSFAFGSSGLLLMQGGGGGATTCDFGGSGLSITGIPTLRWNSTTSNTSSSSLIFGSLPEGQRFDVYLVKMPTGTTGATLSGSVEDLDTTGFTGALSGNPLVYGNLTFSSTTSYTGTPTFASISATPRTIQTNGVSITGGVIFNGVGGTWSLSGALTCTATLTLTAGSLQTNGYTVSAVNYSLNGSLVRSIDIGAGTLNVSGSGATWSAVSTNLTFAGTGTINMTASAAKTFAGGGIQTYPTLNQGGTGALTISGSNKFANITNTVIGSVLFTGGTTNEFEDFNLNGTSTAARLTVGSTNTTQAILKKPGAWNVGSGSLDGGNNTGLSFV